MKRGEGKRKSPSDKKKPTRALISRDRITEASLSRVDGMIAYYRAQWWWAHDVSLSISSWRSRILLKSSFSRLCATNNNIVFVGDKPWATFCGSGLLQIVIYIISQDMLLFFSSFVLVRRLRSRVFSATSNKIKWKIRKKNTDKLTTE